MDIWCAPRVHNLYRGVSISVSGAGSSPEKEMVGVELRMVGVELLI